MLTRSGYYYTLSGSLNFALMALFVGLVHRLDPTLSVGMTTLVRSVLNLLVLFALAFRQPRSLLGDMRPALWYRGLFGGLALIGYFAALSRTGVGEAAFLNQTSAVWVALLAPLVLAERSQRWVYLAIAGSLVGVALLTLPRAGDEANWMGRLFGAGSGLLAALAYLMVRKASSSNTPEAIVFYFSLVSVGLSLGLIALEPSPLPTGRLEWLYLGIIGLSATAGQLLMTRAFQIGPVAAVAAVGYANPLLSAFLGWWALKQQPDLWGGLGMVLIFACGIALPFARTGSG